MNRGRGWRALLTSAVILSTLLALSPTIAAPSAFVFTEEADWLQKDFAGGDDGFTALVVEDVDADGTQEIIAVGYATQDGTDQGISGSLAMSHAKIAGSPR